MADVSPTNVSPANVLYPIKPRHIDTATGLEKAFETAKQRENMVRAIKFWQMLEPEFNSWPLISADEVQSFCVANNLGDFDVACLLATEDDTGFLTANGAMYEITHEAICEAFWVAPKVI